MMAARDGAHVPLPEYPAVKSTPARAIESMLGVDTLLYSCRPLVPVDLTVRTDRIADAIENAGKS
jgi:hypothetical protein